jgi:uncharacterized protein (TIGR03083 family)
VLSTERAIAAIRHHGLGLADAAEGNFDASVDCCPGWSVADLVWHVRRVHYFWGSMVEGLFDDPDRVPEIGRPVDNEQLLADYRTGVVRMADILANADQTAQLWTWSHQKDVAFVTRHQVQEAAVHHWDAETSAGKRIKIDPDVAEDSVDEFLEHSTPGRFPDAEPLSGSVHLHASDTQGEWVIREDDDRRLSIIRGHEHADVALSATSSDLLLILYRRFGPEHAAVHGDRTLLGRFLDRTDLD